MEDRVSEQIWSGYNYERWHEFLKHDWNSPSRQVAYDVVRSCLGKRRLTLGEIGFGDACDFKKCFKPLHDARKIFYTGIDYMQSFVDYATTDFPDYTWKQGEFLLLNPMSFDITYTRATLQHQSPDSYEECIKTLLKASRLYCIVSWHPPLGKQGFNFSNSWCNEYDKKKVDALITQCGFEIAEFPAGDDTIYKMKREHD